MFDGGQVLAAARLRQVSDGGQIVRARWHRYLIFVVVVLATTAYALYTLMGASTATLSSLPNSHGSTVLFQSIEVLCAALLLLSVFVLATWRFLRARLRVLVLLPEGFVYGLARNHQVLACASYRDVAHVRLRVVGRIAVPLFSHLELVCTDRDGVEITWRIEEVLALPAPEIARRVLTAWASIGAASEEAAEGQAAAGQTTMGQTTVEVVPSIPASAVAAWSLAGRAARSWRVLVPKVPALFWWRLLRTYAPLLLLTVWFGCGSVVLLTILVLSLLSRSATAATVWLFIIGSLLAEGGALFAAFHFLGGPLNRRRHLMNQVIVLTPWALMLADRRSAHVDRELRFDDLAELRLRRWLGSFTLVMRAKTGRTWTLPLYEDQFAAEVPAYFVQDVFVYAARFAVQYASAYGAGTT